MTHLKEACTYDPDLTLKLEKVMRVYFHSASQDPTFYQLQLSLRLAPVKRELHEAILPWAGQQEQLIEVMCLPQPRLIMVTWRVVCTAIASLFEHDRCLHSGSI